jgi:ribosomal protein S18 acetylase RimI-like enzyme
MKNGHAKINFNEALSIHLNYITLILVTIRPGMKEDAEMIADISRYCFYHTYAPVNTKANLDKYMQEQFSHEMLMEEVVDDNNIFLLAYHLGNISGYAKLLNNSAHSKLGSKKQVEIVRFYVLPDFKGKGVGTQLMRACINYAKSKEADFLWLGVWEKNEPAIGFYSSLGFEKFSKHKFKLGDDEQTDCLMFKNLEED